MKMTTALGMEKARTVWVKQWVSKRWKEQDNPNTKEAVPW